ncbi:MAG: RHS repeat-associated core domain-containing protein [Phycisphaerales bacterium]
MVARIRYSAFGLPTIVPFFCTSDFDDGSGNGVPDGGLSFDDLIYYYGLFNTGNPRADLDGGDYTLVPDGGVTVSDLLAYLGLNAYGKVSNLDDVRFAYRGYQYDPHLNLYHVRHRVLDPELGRWLQRDPAGFVDGLNLYAYTRSSPFGASDPYGLYMDTESNIGMNNGQWGTWYHIYDRGWFGFSYDHVNSFFVPNSNSNGDNTKAYDDVVDEFSRRQRELLNEIGAGAALASDVLEMVQAAGALAIVVVVPGPEDLVLAAAMFAKGIRFFLKIGEEIVGIGKAGEKIALNADEALAVEKLAAKEAGAASKAEDAAKACKPSKSADLPIAAQKQAGHIPGTPQYANRIKQGKTTSAFFGEESGYKWTQKAWREGTPTADPKIKYTMQASR